MGLAETIREFNEAGGREARGQEAPALQVTPPEPATPPAAQTPPPTPAPASPSPETPKQATPPAPAQAQTLPKDPSFVKAGAPAATPPGGAAAAPATPPPASVPEDVLHSRLSELTNGSVKTTKDLLAVLDQYKQLEEQAKKGFEPKFKDERAKLVHKLLSDNAGREPEVAMRTLRALNFKPEGKTEKDLLFEAYLLDPKNSDLSELQAQRFFEAEYEQKYADITENPLRQREQQLAVKDARAMIEKIQSDFKQVEEQPLRISKEVEDAVTAAVQNFGGVKLSFSDNPQENEMLTVTLGNPQELRAIQEAILKPDEAYNNFLSKFDFRTPQGYAHLAQELWERENHAMLRQQAFDHGRKLGRLDEVNKLRNATTPKDISQTGTPAATAKQSFHGAWLDAVKAKENR